MPLASEGGTIMVNEQELNRKLAEWVGIKQVNVHCGTRDSLGRLADGSHLEVQLSNGTNISVFPNFTQSLDACFEWLIPIGVKHYDDKYGKGCPKETKTAIGQNFMATLLVGWLGSWQSKTPQEETPTALDFCLAIEKLVDKEAQDAIQ